MGVLSDLRQAFRSLSRAPGFTALASLTLALGIGATTAVFGVVDGVLLRPLPYPNPERLVRVTGVDRVNPSGGDDNLSPADLQDLRAASRCLDLAALSRSRITLTGHGEPMVLEAAIASGNVFDVLRTRAQLGRTLRIEDELPGDFSVVLLSHSLWQRVFGADPGVVGRTLTLNWQPLTVVGVLPPGFVAPLDGERGQPDVWRPLPRANHPGHRGQHWLWGLGRLAEGASLAEAHAELDVLTAALEAQYPDTNTGRRTRLLALHEALVAGARPTLGALSAAVGVLLLIACANLTNLILLRHTRRQAELAIHMVLGAGRARLVRRLLAESLLIAALGGVLGALLASWAVAGLLAATAGSLPRVAEVRVDGRVLVVGGAIALASALLAGLAPAWRLAGRGLAESLRSGVRTASDDRAARRTRGMLVVAQVSLSVTLLACAGLLGRSLWRLLSVDPGFRPDRALSLRISLPAARYPEDADAAQALAELLRRVSLQPGVEAAGFVNILPLGGGNSCDGVTVAEHPPVPPGQERCAEARYATPDYFRALRIPLRRGRLILPGDARSAPRVALVNEALVRRFFPDQDPLGRHLVYNEAPWEIVGIVGDVRHFALDRDPEPEFYLPHAQLPIRGGALVVRSAAGPEVIAAGVRAALRGLDPELPVSSVATLTDLVQRSADQPRFRALLVGVFAGLALALAAIGLFGVLSYGVSQRTREIGVRMALGARTGHVVRHVLAHGLALAGVGTALGVAGALGASRLLASQLYGISPHDPATLAAVAAALLLVAAAASYLPARRATRIDPITALRLE